MLEDAAMAQWTVDPLNPGEILACCGIAYLAWTADRTAVTGFTQEGRWYFRAPDGVLDAIPAPAPSPTPTGLTLCGLALDWWQPWGLNPDLKTWAGQQTALSVHRNLTEAAADNPIADWQTGAATTTGRLNLDIHGTWNALAIGWSLNEHKDREMLCRPWLELLASLGLQGFPVSGGRRDGFSYHLWRPAPLAAAVAAFQGDGPGVYALRGFTCETGKLGSNTMLLRAIPNP
jgi:CRISPR-associated protein Csx14